MKQFPAKNPLGTDSFISKFYPTFKEELTLIHYKLLKKTGEKEILPSSFFEALIPKPKLSQENYVSIYFMNINSMFKFMNKKF